MLSFSPIEKPKIDIELYGTDINIAPIDKVHIMDEDSFEHFTLEWLYGCKKDKYSSIMRIGGAGDKGRDVIAYRKDGGVDYFQCKHYNSALAPSNYYLELGKLCYYTYTKDIPLPKSYYIVASNDIGPTLQDLLDNSAQLLSSLLDNWDTYCRFKITKSKEINLDADLLGYIRSFDFSIIKTYPIAQIIDEHLNTVYGSIRFGTRTPTLPAPLSPSAEIDPEEMEYVSALLAAYSEELGMIIDTPKALEAYERFFSHFNRQRKDYYSAETIRRFVRDTLISSFQFDVLKEEIYNGIIDVHEQDYSTGYKRLVADLQQAAITNKWIKLFLEDCKYPNLTSLIFDKATMDIVLNGKKKSANGKGYNAYLNSAVAIVLSRYMQKHAHYAPGLILLDSPILSLKEIDTQKPSQSMRSGLFENIASTSEGIQTIVIENEIPEIDYSNVNLIHFTKNANTGRYGFLIDVMD